MPTFSNIKLIPVSNSVKLTGLNSTFLNRFKSVWSSLGIVEIEITSGVRKDFSKSFHFSGEALDIHSIKYSNGKKIFFHSLNSNYNSSDDRRFFDILKIKLGDMLQEYISPAIVKTSGSSSRYNIYWDADKKTIAQKLAVKSQKGKYDPDVWHLDHLHLAIAKRFTTKQKAGGGLLLLGLGVAGYLYWRKKKNGLYLS